MDATVIDDEDEDEYMPGQPIKQEMATDGGNFDQFDPGGVTVHETSPLSRSARQSKVKVRDQIRRETLSEIIQSYSPVDFNTLPVDCTGNLHAVC